MSNKPKIKTTAPIKSQVKTVDVVGAPIPGETVLFSCHVPEQLQAVGWCYIVKGYDNSVLLLHIQTAPGWKRRGVASAIIKSLQEEFAGIVTSWITDEGKSLCIKHGFATNLTNKGVGLVWAKQ